MRQSRFIPAFFLALFGGIWASLLASCTLNPFETQGRGVEPTLSIPCSTNDNCDDNNPCTIDKCNTATKICEVSLIPNGAAPNAEQTPKDCARIDCVEGIAKSVEDPADLPNDGNACTEDVCKAGTPRNTVTPYGTVCMQGTQAGICDTATCIVACDASKPCNDGNPCTDEFCNVATSSCVFTNVDGLPTPGFTQIVGDCNQRLCITGTDTAIVDQSDVPDDMNSCTQDLCDGNGMTSFPGQPAGTPCTLGDVKVCDGMSACVECTLPIHCVGIVEDECTQRDCVNNTCQPKYAGTDTLASAALQLPGDCKKTVCDGAGGTMLVNDDTEIPDDGVACTAETCSNGAPMFTPKASGTSCGAAQVCNATGQCVGCNAPIDCAGVDDDCKTRTCIANVCGFSYTANNTQVPNVQVDKDCKVVVCDGAGNMVTRVDTNDILVDGNDCTKDLCNAGGAPSNPNEPFGTTCTSNGGNVCDGNGTCKKENGQTCSMPNGTQCLSTFCVDGYCCNNSCATTCKSCALINNLGTCSNIPLQTTDNYPTNACSGNNVCNGAGSCKKQNGQACAMDNECASNKCNNSVCAP